MRNRRGQGWADRIFDAVLADESYWRHRTHIPGPESETAWTHFYFCDDDGTRLAFDPAMPSEHRCPRCDRLYRGGKWDGAWRTQMHTYVADQSQRYALIARLSDDQEQSAHAVAAVAAIVEQYGNDYAGYRRHGEHAGIGKVQPQSLSEAIWLITVLRSVRWTEELLPRATLAAAERLAAQAVDLLRPQVSMIHNIHCWLLAALAECAARLRDDELLRFTAHSEFGVINQLHKGFRNEGIWYEISPAYHYYTVAALLSWSEAVGPQALGDDDASILARAISCPVELAYSDGGLPAYADCWPTPSLYAYAAQAEAAYGLLPTQTIDPGRYYTFSDEAPVELWTGANQPGRGDAPSIHGRATVAALIFGPDAIDSGRDPQTSSFWPDAGIAVLRQQGHRIALRCGPDGGGHDHRDKLAVDIETASGWCSLDLGTSGYGAEFTNWLRSPTAHNTVFVGRQRQPACDGNIVEAGDSHAVGAVSWPGCRMRRRIEITDTGWTDIFQVELDWADEINWVLHGDGTIIAAGAGATLDELGAAPGRDHLRQLRRIDSRRGQVEVRWNLDGAPTAWLQFPAGFVIYAAVADGNPNGRPLGVVFVRGIAREATITARFTAAH